MTIDFVFNETHCERARIYGKYRGPDMVLLEDLGFHSAMIHTHVTEAIKDNIDYRAETPLGLYVTIECLYKAWRLNPTLKFSVHGTLNFYQVNAIRKLERIWHFVPNPKS